ncbi:MAG: hypothetical protein ABSH50_09740 [Bryobacteraceae bacterium]
MSRKSFLSVILYAAISTTAVHAQYLLTYPGPAAVNQGDATVTFFDPATLKPGASTQVPGAFQFLSLPDGSEFYFIANNPTTNTIGVIVVAHPQARTNPSGVGGVHPIETFANALNCAALSPDGTRLVVGENAVHFIDTGTNIDLTPNGIAVGSGATIIGVAVSYDSQTVYALATYNGTSYLDAISTAQLSVTNSITITGTASALALGPNGLLYLGMPNQILEINPATLATTPNGAVAVNITPGPLAFTPDGNYLVAANQIYGPQPSILLVNLNDHLVEGEIPFTGLAALQSSPLTGTSAIFDSLYVASSTVIYPFSSLAQSLWVMQLGSNGGLILDVPVIPDVISSAQAAMTLSNDLGVPGRNYPQFLFTVSSGTVDGTGVNNLFSIDPASNLLTAQVALVDTPGAVAYYAPTFTNNAPTTILQYGNNQTLLPGGVSLPMVIRLLDQNGLPISGAGVSYSPSAGSITPINTVTGADGYSEAIYTAGSTPADIGAILINATVGQIAANFNVTVGTGQIIQPAALTIVSGQGQFITEDPTLSTPPYDSESLVILATDSNGNPVPNALVTFTVTSGSGALNSPNGPETAVVVPTNSTGQASISFIPPVVGGSESDTVTASVVISTTNSSGTTTTTTISQNFYLTTMALDVSYCTAPPCSPALIPLIAEVLQPLPGAVLTGSAGSTLPNPVLVQVNSISGLPVPNIAVHVSTGTSTSFPNASCAGSNGGVALTNAAGLATCNVVLNGVPGTKPLDVSIPVLGQDTGPGLVFSSYTLTITPGAPANVNIITGNNQVGITGATLTTPFIVKVTDSLNNPIPNTPLSWTVTSGSMILSGVSTTTGPTGEGTATGDVESPAGTTITLQVTAGTASATFTVLVSAPASSIKAVSGDNQSAQVNTPLSAPLVVQLLTKSGTPAAYAPLVFTATGGQKLIATGSTSVPSSVVILNADDNGMASVTVTSVGPIAGTFTVSATYGAGKTALTAKFTVTAEPLGPSGPAILNSASLLPGIAPGALVTFLGPGLTPTIQGVVTEPSQIEGYSISFDGIPAPILALVNENGIQQINAQVPFEESPSTSDTITIATPLGSVLLPNVTVSLLAPGIFTSGTLTANGSTYPLAVVVRSDGSYASAANPVLRGEAITFYATGLGQVVPTASDGVPGVPGQVVGSTLYAGVNNQGDAVLSAIYQPNAVGVYAITIQVPSATLAGPAQPLSLLMEDLSGNGYSAPLAYVPIQ